MSETGIEVMPNAGTTTSTNTTPPMGPLPTYQNAPLLYYFGRGLLRILASVMFDFKAYGIKHIPRTGGVLIVSNHQSYLDPALSAIQVLRPASFLGKSELFENAIFGAIIRRLNAFPVRQGQGDVGAVRETINRLREGHVLTMFPEGGRSETAEIEPMQAGVGLIVRRAGPTVKVVPAAVCGAFEAWSRHRKLPTPRPVRLKYGPPMSLSHLDKDEIITIIDREIRRLYGELRSGNYET